jgi:hypothetical protein
VSVRNNKWQSLDNGAKCTTLSTFISIEWQTFLTLGDNAIYNNRHVFRKRCLWTSQIVRKEVRQLARQPASRPSDTVDTVQSVILSVYLEFPFAATDMCVVLRRRCELTLILVATSNEVNELVSLINIYGARIIVMNERQRKATNRQTRGNDEGLELWRQAYVTWFPEKDVRNCKPLDFCWSECTLLPLTT